MKGQGLVEFAIVLPILIFMLLGLFEVGWALRGYLVLIAANREAARYAVKGDYLANPANVYTHTLESISSQLDFENNGVMLIHKVEVEGQCTDVYTVTYPIEWRSAAVASKIDFPALEEDLKRHQHNHTCAQIEAGFIPYKHELVIVEMWYNQPQLFGLMPFLNPVPMYTSSTFRKLRERQ